MEFNSLESSRSWLFRQYVCLSHTLTTNLGRNDSQDGSGDDSIADHYHVCSVSPKDQFAIEDEIWFANYQYSQEYDGSDIYFSRDEVNSNDVEDIDERNQSDTSCASVEEISAVAGSCISIGNNTTNLWLPDEVEVIFSSGDFEDNNNQSSLRRSITKKEQVEQQQGSLFQKLETFRISKKSEREGNNDLKPPTKLCLIKDEESSNQESKVVDESEISNSEVTTLSKRQTLKQTIAATDRIYPTYSSEASSDDDSDTCLHYDSTIQLESGSDLDQKSFLEEKSYQEEGAVVCQDNSFSREETSVHSKAQHNCSHSNEQQKEMLKTDSNSIIISERNSMPLHDSENRQNIKTDCESQTRSIPDDTTPASHSDDIEKFVDIDLDHDEDNNDSCDHLETIESIIVNSREEIEVFVGEQQQSLLTDSERKPVITILIPENDCNNSSTSSSICEQTSELLEQEENILDRNVDTILVDELMSETRTNANEFQELLQRFTAGLRQRKEFFEMPQPSFLGVDDIHHKKRSNQKLETRIISPKSSSNIDLVSEENCKFPLIITPTIAEKQQIPDNEYQLIKIEQPCISQNRNHEDSVRDTSHLQNQEEKTVVNDRGSDVQEPDQDSSIPIESSTTSRVSLAQHLDDLNQNRSGKDSVYSCSNSSELGRINASFQEKQECRNIEPSVTNTKDVVFSNIKQVDDEELIPVPIQFLVSFCSQDHQKSVDKSWNNDDKKRTPCSSIEESTDHLVQKVFSFPQHVVPSQISSISTGESNTTSERTSSSTEYDSSMTDESSKMTKPETDCEVHDTSQASSTFNNNAINTIEDLVARSHAITNGKIVQDLGSLLQDSVPALQLSSVSLLSQNMQLKLLRLRNQIFPSYDPDLPNSATLGIPYNGQSSLSCLSKEYSVDHFNVPSSETYTPNATTEVEHLIVIDHNIGLVSERDSLSSSKQLLCKSDKDKTCELDETHNPMSETHNSMLDEENPNISTIFVKQKVNDAIEAVERSTLPITKNLVGRKLLLKQRQKFLQQMTIIGGDTKQPEELLNVFRTKPPSEVVIKFEELLKQEQKQSFESTLSKDFEYSPSKESVLVSGRKQSESLPQSLHGGNQTLQQIPIVVEEKLAHCLDVLENTNVKSAENLSSFLSMPITQNGVCSVEQSKQHNVHEPQLIDYLNCGNLKNSVAAEKTRSPVDEATALSLKRLSEKLTRLRAERRSTRIHQQDDGRDENETFPVQQFSTHGIAETSEGKDNHLHATDENKKLILNDGSRALLSTIPSDTYYGNCTDEKYNIDREGNIDSEDVCASGAHNELVSVNDTKDENANRMELNRDLILSDSMSITDVLAWYNKPGLKSESSSNIRTITPKKIQQEAQSASNSNKLNELPMLPRFDNLEQFRHLSILNEFTGDDFDIEAHNMESHSCDDFCSPNFLEDLNSDNSCELVASENNKMDLGHFVADKEFVKGRCSDQTQPDFQSTRLESKLSSDEIISANSHYQLSENALVENVDIHAHNLATGSCSDFCSLKLLEALNSDNNCEPDPSENDNRERGHLVQPNKETCSDRIYHDLHQSTRLERRLSSTEIISSTSPCLSFENISATNDQSSLHIHPNIGKNCSVDELLSIPTGLDDHLVELTEHVKTDEKDSQPIHYNENHHSLVQNCLQKASDGNELPVVVSKNENKELRHLVADNVIVKKDHLVQLTEPFKTTGIDDQLVHLTKHVRIGDKDAPAIECNEYFLSLVHNCPLQTSAENAIGLEKVDIDKDLLFTISKHHGSSLIPSYSKTEQSTCRNNIQIGATNKLTNQQSTRTATETSMIRKKFGFSTFDTAKPSKLTEADESSLKQISKVSRSPTERAITCKKIKDKHRMSVSLIPKLQCANNNIGAKEPGTSFNSRNTLKILQHEQSKTLPKTSTTFVSSPPKKDLQSKDLTLPATEKKYSSADKIFRTEIKTYPAEQKAAMLDSMSIFEIMDWHSRSSNPAKTKSDQTILETKLAAIQLGDSGLVVGSLCNSDASLNTETMYIKDISLLKPMVNDNILVTGMASDNILATMTETGATILNESKSSLLTTLLDAPEHKECRNFEPEHMLHIDTNSDDSDSVVSVTLPVPNCHRHCSSFDPTQKDEISSFSVTSPLKCSNQMTTRAAHLQLNCEDSDNICKHDDSELTQTNNGDTTNAEFVALPSIVVVQMTGEQTPLLENVTASSDFVIEKDATCVMPIDSSESSGKSLTPVENGEKNDNESAKLPILVVGQATEKQTSHSEIATVSRCARMKEEDARGDISINISEKYANSSSYSSTKTASFKTDTSNVLLDEKEHSEMHGCESEQLGYSILERKCVLPESTTVDSDAIRNRLSVTQSSGDSLMVLSTAPRRTKNIRGGRNTETRAEMRAFTSPVSSPIRSPVTSPVTSPVDVRANETLQARRNGDRSATKIPLFFPKVKSTRKELHRKMMENARKGK